MQAFRSIWRRKVRTILTIFGIAVGIFALTVMGSLASRINTSISLGKQYVTGQISISPKGSESAFSSSGGTLTRDLLDRVAKVPGVEGVQAEIMMPAKDSSGGGFGNSQTIWGQDLSVQFQNKNIKSLAVKQGRKLRNGDGNVVVIGSRTASSNNWKLNQSVKVRGHKFTVVGILDQTLSEPDQYIMMPLAPAQGLLVESNTLLTSLKQRSESAKSLTASVLDALPADQRVAIEQSQNFDQSTLATGAAAFWRDGQDPTKVARAIKKAVPEVDATDPVTIGKQIDQASAIFNLIILGSALIALIVGSLSIINTMIMSVTERHREIGIKKAVGAPTNRIIREFIAEAGLLGLLGGLIGLGGGSLLIWLIGQTKTGKEADIFQLSPSLAIGVVSFAIILGIVAGLYPAFAATRVDPVKALREE
jgi:putative ABC transport system permease protein